MPELPEVETIRRHLVPRLEGRTIAAVELRLPRLLLEPGPAAFARRLAGRAIAVLKRRGKYLIFELDDGQGLVIHLGMTGQLTWSPAEYREDGRFERTVTGLARPLGVHPVDRHTHLLLRLGDGGRLLFRDPRTFGKIFLPAGDWRLHPRLAKLGAEPLELRPGEFLRRHFPAASSRPIKALLLDQAFLAGVGNIYADEALFRSGLHPALPVRAVGPEQGALLLASLRRVLRKSIRHAGTTFSDYRKPDGSTGGYFDRLQVYGRGGEPCVRCGAALRKTVVAQRGTVYCPGCQGDGKPRGAGRSANTGKGARRKGED